MGDSLASIGAIGEGSTDIDLSRAGAGRASAASDQS